MTQTRPHTPVARGRIIRKGGLGSHVPTARPREEVKALPRREGAVSVSPQSDDSRRSLKLIILLPLVSAASAAFMWASPAQEARMVESSSGATLHTRFADLGNEISNRFAPRNGEVREPRKAKPSVAPKAPAQVKVERTSTSEVPKQVADHKVAAMENQVYKVLKRHGKPTANGKALAAAIVKESIAQSYDPVFVAAVIKSESAFNALARSHKGAQGLMQIMPKTGAWLADQQSIPRGKLTDPGHNLRLGISYLKKLESEYGGNRVLTLVAYNWGPGHVELASSGSRRVPGEVMQYAVKILNDYRRWTSELNSSVG